jgi:hypothetical protein
VNNHRERAIVSSSAARERRIRAGVPAHYALFQGLNIGLNAPDHRAGRRDRDSLQVPPTPDGWPPKFLMSKNADRYARRPHACSR